MPRIDALEPRRLLSFTTAIDFYGPGPTQPLPGVTASWDRDPAVLTRGDGSYTLTLSNLPAHAEAQVDVFTSGYFDPNEDVDPGSDFITHVIDGQSSTHDVREPGAFQTTRTFAHSANSIAVTWRVTGAEDAPGQRYDEWSPGHVTVTLALPEVVLKPRDTAEEGGAGGGWTVERYGDFGVASIDVNLQAVGGTASSGTDYGALPAKVTLAGSDTAKNVDLPVTDDNAVEWTESVDLKIAPPSSSGGQYGILTWYGENVSTHIADNDLPPVKFSGSPVVNADDDDCNGVPDYNDAGPVSDNDLVPIDWDFPSDSPAGASITLRANTAKARVWANPDKTGLLFDPTTYGYRTYYHGDESQLPPKRVYMEALEPSYSTGDSEKFFAKVELSDWSRSPWRVGEAKTYTYPTLPVAGVEATDDVAREHNNDPATFEVRLTQDASGWVYFRLQGTAVAGQQDGEALAPVDADYQVVGAEKDPASGLYKVLVTEGTAQVSVTPFNDPLDEANESITLQIVAEPGNPVPPTYAVADPGPLDPLVDLAGATIVDLEVRRLEIPDDDTAQDPEVALGPSVEDLDEPDFVVRDAASQKIRQELRQHPVYEEYLVGIAADPNTAPETKNQLNAILGEVFPIHAAVTNVGGKFQLQLKLRPQVDNNVRWDLKVELADFLADKDRLAFENVNGWQAEKFTFMPGVPNIPAGPVLVPKKRPDDENPIREVKIKVTWQRRVRTQDGLGWAFGVDQSRFYNVVIREQEML